MTWGKESDRRTASIPGGGDDDDVGYTAWVRRAAAHPQVAAALAEGHILSESVARKICQWTDKLPEDCRLAADAILIVAAKSGADLRGLAELVAEIYARSLPDPGTAPGGDRTGNR